MTKFDEMFITRHRDLIDLTKLNTKIMVVGAGAIGSFTVLSLAKMGFNQITVIDYDTVSAENIGNQFYPVSAIGKPKVEALRDMIREFSGIEVNAVNRKVQPNEFLESAIIISAVDSMEARSSIFASAVCRYYIDARMGAEYAVMYTVDMLDTAARTNYKRTLYTDSQALQERCTAKSTVYTVTMIAGQVVKAIKDITTGKPYLATLDWYIDQNTLVAFNNLGEKR